MRHVDVVIVGAGPAGLISALLLARKGVEAVLVEKRSATSYHPKARGLNVRTMEILRSLGLEAEVKQAGEALRKGRYMLFVESLAGKEERRIPDDDLMMSGDALSQYTPCTWVQCAQDTLERLLAARATEAGAELHFGTRLETFQQDEQGASCTIVSERAGKQEVRARYMIACDGAKSEVREQLGIQLGGRAAIEHFVNIYFEADLKPLVQERWFGICFVDNPAVQGLFLPVDNDRRWLLNVQYDPAKESAQGFTTERCKTLVQAATGDASIDVKVLSALPWVASSLVASHLRKGRVFLAGDAGHILPPAGGFGLNLAVQDAHNLAWKLAGVLRGKLHASALDSYEAERLPAAASVAQYSEDEMDSERPWEHEQRDEAGSSSERHEAEEEQGPPGTSGEQEGGDRPWEQTLEQQLETVIGFQYRSNLVRSAYAPDGLKMEAAPGTRFPHVWIAESVSTLDRLPQSFCVCGPESQSSGVGPDLPYVALPVDIWRKVAGDRDIESVLVRPDGVVAAAGSLEEVKAFYGTLLCSRAGQSGIG